MLDCHILLTTAFVGLGGSLFGYDIGIISGVLDMQSFLSDFGTRKTATPTPSPSLNLTTTGGASSDGGKFALDPWMQGFVVSAFVIGNCLGAAVSGQVSDRFGRRATLGFGSALFLVGALMQTFATVLNIFLAGRFFAGLAVGLLCMVVPLLNSELAPRAWRGTLISFNQIAMTSGILVAFWVNYALQNFHNGWRYALGGQCVPAALLLLGLPMLPRSPRWLVRVGRTDEAKATLRSLRRTDGAAVADAEFARIVQDWDEELSARATASLSPVSTFLTLVADAPARRRLMVGVVIQTCQQLTGINCIMYYAPGIFEALGLPGQLSQGINGVINVLSTIAGFFLVDRCGRRPLLLVGAACMAVAMATLGAVGAAYSTVGGSDGSTVIIESQTAGYVCVVALYFFVANFAYSWGPVCWLLPTEIFPLAHRANGVATTTAANFLWNVVVAQFTPILLAKMHFHLFLLFAALCVGMGVFVAFELPETKGILLEDIQEKFRTQRSVVMCCCPGEGADGDGGEYYAHDGTAGRVRGLSKDEDLFMGQSRDNIRRRPLLDGAQAVSSAL